MGRAKSTVERVLKGRAGKTYDMAGRSAKSKGRKLKSKKRETLYRKNLKKGGFVVVLFLKA